MNDRKLEVLITVLRVGSFSKAAEELSCTQSAVTQVMNRIEDEFGFRIVERSHSGVRLTEAGERLYPYLINAELGIRQLMNQVAHISQSRAIPLRIGTFSSIAHTWLPRMLIAYNREHPEVVFNIRVGTSVLGEWLFRGEVDVVLGDAERCRAFRFTPLHDDPFFAVVPDTAVFKDRERMTQEEMLEMPFIMAPEDALENHMGKIPANRINVSCDDDSALLALVEAGMGATLLPKLCLQDSIHDVHVLEFDPPTKRVIGIALPNTAIREARSFSSFIVKEFADKNVV